MASFVWDLAIDDEINETSLNKTKLATESVHKNGGKKDGGKKDGCKWSAYFEFGIFLKTLEDVLGQALALDGWPVVIDQDQIESQGPKVSPRATLPVTKIIAAGNLRW